MALFRKKKDAQSQPPKKSSSSRTLTAEGWRRKREKETGIRSPLRSPKKGKK